MILSSIEVSPSLAQRLEEARARKVSEEELREQRISFAFGNAPKDAQLITRDSVRRSARNLLLQGDEE